MNDEMILEMLKVDLGLTSDAYDIRLQSIIDGAKRDIVREGVSNLNTGSSVADANLVIMYAAWIWRKRDTMEGMPRMLRWKLNNRVFGVKMQS